LVFSYLGLFLAAELYNLLLPKFGFSFPHQLAALPLLTLVLMLYGFITMPIQNIISRKFEFEADEFALNTTQNRDAFISTIEKLAKTNLSDKKPHPIVEFLFYSHPSIEKRIAAAKNSNFDQRNNYEAQTI
jgi:STE24 endopeptidase